MARHVSLRGKALVGLREAELVAQHVHQVGGVAAVEHAEARRRDRRRRHDGESGDWRSSGTCPTREIGQAGGLTPGFLFWTGVGTRNSPTIRCVRRVISSAARRVKVSSRMRSGFAPDSTRCATRCASVLVLPVPAPAIISSGPDPNSRGFPLLAIQENRERIHRTRA